MVRPGRALGSPPDDHCIGFFADSFMLLAGRLAAAPAGSGTLSTAPGLSPAPGRLARGAGLGWLLALRRSQHRARGPPCLHQMGIRDRRPTPAPGFSSDPAWDATS